MESKESQWIFLKDIKSLLMTSWKKIRCIVFSIVKTGSDYKRNDILELSATEIENFRLTGKIYHMHIKPRLFNENNNLNILSNDYKDYEHYNQDTKQQFQNLINFIGNDSFLITHISSDCHFLMNEFKYWNLQEIRKERFRCTFEIANKIFKKKENHANLVSLNDFCDYFKIEYSNENYFNNNLYNCLMTAKIFIHLYESYNSIYIKKNKLNVEEEKKIEIIKTKNIPKMEQIQQTETKIKKKNENESHSLFKNMLNKMNSHTKEKASAYIAVSSKNNETFSYAGCISCGNKDMTMKGIVENDYSKMGSPGAVMFACIRVIDSLIESGETSEINIFSSYTGIENFASNKWTPDQRKLSTIWEKHIKEKNSLFKINYATVNNKHPKIKKAKDEAMSILK